MTKLSKSEVLHLATLARLHLTDAEAQQYADQLSDVVGYVEQLHKVSVSQYAPHGVSGMQNVYMDDQVRSPEDATSIQSSQVIQAAPKWKEKHVVVQAVLSGEVEAS